MNIVSLLPAATEMVCLLGLEKSLVGISDDSDYPTSVSSLPKITTTTIDPTLSSLEIDKKVKTAKHRGSSVFHIDRQLLGRLAPDIILTQELCPVCAPALTDIEKVSKQILSNATLLSLKPHTIEDIFDNIREIARHTYTEKSAKKSISHCKKRLSTISQQVKDLEKPSVLIVEWLDPLMIAGHWVPEMVERAGGTMLLAKKKERSKMIAWEDVLRLDPAIMIIAPCGFSITRTKQELSLITKKKGFASLKAYRTNNIYLLDGNAYLTRPGPRIIDGVEILSEIFYPNLFRRTYPLSAWQKI